jgi:hypothetical protein
LTQIRRYPVAGGAEDACQRVDLHHDSNPFAPAYGVGAYGRLAATRFGGSACVTGEWNQRDRTFTVDLRGDVAGGLGVSSLTTLQYQQLILLHEFAHLFGGHTHTLHVADALKMSTTIAADCLGLGSASPVAIPRATRISRMLDRSRLPRVRLGGTQ